jgi:hypothetical protein
MRDAKDWKSISRLRSLRRRGIGSDDVSLAKWDRIHMRLNQARREAEEYAYASLDQRMQAEITRRQIEKELKEEANLAGETLDPTIQELYRK